MKTSALFQTQSLMSKMKKHHISILVCVIYLHALLAFFAFPILSLKYAKLYANVIGNTIEENLVYCSGNTYMYIPLVAFAVFTLGFFKHIKEYYLGVVITGVTINLLLTIYFFKQLFTHPYS